MLQPRGARLWLLALNVPILRDLSLFQQIKKDLKKYSKIFEQKDRLSQSKASKVSPVPRHEGSAQTVPVASGQGPTPGGGTDPGVGFRPREGVTEGPLEEAGGEQTRPVRPPHRL